MPSYISAVLYCSLIYYTLYIIQEIFDITQEILNITQEILNITQEILAVS